MVSRKTFRVPNMCCQNCAVIVQHTLVALAGIQSVKIMVKRKTVTVAWEPPMTWQAIERQLDLNGYPPGPPFA